MADLYAKHKIGCHIKKEKKLADSFTGLDFSRPYQIFLGGPQNSRMSEPADLAEVAEIVKRNDAQIYVHSQYIINLSSATATWQGDLLRKNLEYTRGFGGHGVVVHVGKSVGAPVPEALERMRRTLAAALEHATEECPLLLETPAGQGTETLRGMEEFLDFVESFEDTRLRVCLDTCHVFACGHSPLEYVEAGLARPGLLKLIHFNDSLGGCGSCVDRHAAVGEGKIGVEKMTRLAERCSAAGLPMVIE